MESKKLGIRLVEQKDKIVVEAIRDGKWVTAFKDPKFKITGDVKKFHYEGDQLVIDEMTVEHLKVVPRIELPT